MYCQKMVAYSRDDKLPINCFQDNLSRASLELYMQLKRSNVQTQKDLAKAFLKYYQYNTNIALNRTQLQNLTQKNTESFREYAQRLRQLVACVQPPMLDRELADMFIGTLQDPYFEKMISNTSSTFSDLVTIEERIECGLKSERI